MKQGIILGIIQGITEWLPVSSEGIIVLANIHLFGETDLSESIQLALFLHLGTFFAALIYFRRKIWQLLKSLFHYADSTLEQQATLKFLLISSLMSGLIGFALLQTLIRLEDQLLTSGRVLTGLIGLLLLVTGGLQLSTGAGKQRSTQDASVMDAIILGLVQGLAILPGLSRSGLTISALLLRKFDDTHALTLSFLLSLPVVLGANILLNANHFLLTTSNLLGTLFAFGFGLATIHILLKVSKRMNFGYFVLLFGFLMVGSTLL